MQPFMLFYAWEHFPQIEKKRTVSLKGKDSINMYTKAKRSVNWDSADKIVRQTGGKEKNLPTSYSCFGQLDWEESLRMDGVHPLSSPGPVDSA